MKPFLAFFVFAMMLETVPDLHAQADPGPFNNSNNSNISNVNVNMMRTSILMDPAYGSSDEDNTTNFNSRNFWFSRANSNASDAVAWFNYYRSTRYLAEGGAGFEELQPDLDSIDHHMQKHSANTWEQLMVEYWNSNRDVSKQAALDKAYKLRPYDPLTLRFMIGKEYLSGTLAKARVHYTAWKQTGDAPVSTDTYAYNVMQSLPSDAILFTNGEMDTYPLINQLQATGNSSVKLISIAFCSRPENRATLFAHAGIVLPGNDRTSAIDADYIARVAEANPTKKIYVASTCGGDLLSGLQSNLYCTGLAFRYSSTSIDHLTFLRDNVGTRMQLDGVGKAVKSSHRFDVNNAVKLEMNYYLPLLIAADSYVMAGNEPRAKQLRAKAKAIRVRAGYDEPLRDEGTE